MNDLNQKIFWHDICKILKQNIKRCIKNEQREITKMGLLRGGLAAAGAWKLGGGIISTILVFILLYWLLGFFMR